VAKKLPAVIKTKNLTISLFMLNSPLFALTYLFVSLLCSLTLR